MTKDRNVSGMKFPATFDIGLFSLLRQIGFGRNEGARKKLKAVFADVTTAVERDDEFSMREFLSS